LVSSQRGRLLVPFLSTGGLLTAQPLRPGCERHFPFNAVPLFGHEKETNSKTWPAPSLCFSDDPNISSRAGLLLPARKPLSPLIPFPPHRPFFTLISIFFPSRKHVPPPFLPLSPNTDLRCPIFPCPAIFPFPFHEEGTNSNMSPPIGSLFASAFQYFPCVASNSLTFSGPPHTSFPSKSSSGKFQRAPSPPFWRFHNWQVPPPPYQKVDPLSPPSLEMIDPPKPNSPSCPRCHLLSFLYFVECERLLPGRKNQ